MQFGVELDTETAFAFLLPLLLGIAYFIRVSHLRPTRLPKTAIYADFGNLAVG